MYVDTGCLQLFVWILHSTFANKMKKVNYCHFYPDLCAWTSDGYKFKVLNSLKMLMSSPEDHIKNGYIYKP